VGTLDRAGTLLVEAYDQRLESEDTSLGVSLLASLGINERDVERRLELVGGWSTGPVNGPDDARRLPAVRTAMTATARLALALLVMLLAGCAGADAGEPQAGAAEPVPFEGEGYRLEHPATWQRVPEDRLRQDTAEVEIALPQDGRLLAPFLRVTAEPLVMDLDDYVVLAQGVANLRPDRRVLRQEPVQVPGGTTAVALEDATAQWFRDGKPVIAEPLPEDECRVEEVPVRRTSVFATDGRTVYLLEVITPEEDLPAIEAQLSAITDSFTLVPPRAPTETR
jgi:hypothetical protein